MQSIQQEKSKKYREVYASWKLANKDYQKTNSEESRLKVRVALEDLNGYSWEEIEARA